MILSLSLLLSTDQIPYTLRPKHNKIGASCVMRDAMRQEKRTFVGVGRDVIDRTCDSKFQKRIRLIGALGAGQRGAWFAGRASRESVSCVSCRESTIVDVPTAVSRPDFGRKQCRAEMQDMLSFGNQPRFRHVGAGGMTMGILTRAICYIL